MPKFKYTAKNEKQKKIRGLLNAKDQAEAILKLKADGLTIISVSEKKSRGLDIFTRPHLGFEDKMMFTKQISAMIQAGITIAEALQIMAEQTKKPNNRKMYETLVEMVRSGETLANSMSTYKSVFSQIFINMVDVGEKSGTLQEVLQYLDAQIEKEYELRKKIIGAMVYPAVIISITVMLSLGIVFFIMPKITDIFKTFDVELPLPTRVLIGISEFATGHPILTFAGLAGAIAMSIFFVKNRHTKPIWHKILLYTPIFGRVIIYMNLARFARTLNSLLKAGVPISRALQVTSTMFTDHFYTKMVEEAREKVEKGSRLDEALSGNEKLFPLITTKMLHIGEESGNLELATEHLAKLYERHVDSITKNLSVMLEPILLVLMGLMVGGVALSIILPIYQLPNLIQS